MNNWYQSLQRPPLTPPSWVFGPVWTVLYVMIAVAIILFLKNYRAESRAAMYLLIVTHVVANFAWTPLFFGLQRPGLALLDIVFLDTTLIMMIYCFWQTSRPASVLLMPYLAWVLFATYLNLGFWLLNRT